MIGGFMKKKWTVVELVIGLILIGIIIFWIAAVYAGIHFICKFW